MQTHATSRPVVLLSILAATALVVAGSGCGLSKAAPAKVGDVDSKENKDVAAVSRLLDGKNWPHYRGGPTARGITHASLPKSPQLLWKTDLKQGPIESSAIVVDGMIYVGCLDGGLNAVDLKSGKKKWTLPTEIGINASPAYRDGRVYVGDVDGIFYCVNAADGKLAWKFPTEAAIDNSANFYKDNVLVGSQDARL
ncbi:MAG: PQQ-binding-like beta-propeller repeat protein, partial [Planctomycetes bacterium]|nr:PQQ-binding-like beta-propeller repeat protein [Planctomycetota bacterium]